jgi:hypothetical protein
MRQRCNNPRHAQYKNYGGRGISICADWQDFSVFLRDMGPKPDGLTIERINNDGNYEAANCRWANRAEQRRNQRTCKILEFNGECMTVEEWGRKIGRDPDTLHHRLRKNYPIEMVLSSEKFLMGNKSPLAARKEEGK